MKSDTKSISWFLTINNPSPEEENFETLLKNAPFADNVKYAKAAREEGEKEQTPHIHIYLHLKEQERFSAIKKVFPRADIGEPIATPQAQIDYIGNPNYTYSKNHPDKEKVGKKKGGTCIWTREIGTTEGIKLNKRPRRAGTLDARLEAMQSAIKEGKQKPELYELDFSIMIRYGERLASYMSMIDQEQAKETMSKARQWAEDEVKADRDEALAMIEKYGMIEEHQKDVEEAITYKRNLIERLLLQSQLLENPTNNQTAKAF